MGYSVKSPTRREARVEVQVMVAFSFFSSLSWGRRPTLPRPSPLPSSPVSSSRSENSDCLYRPRTPRAGKARRSIERLPVDLPPVRRSGIAPYSDRARRSGDRAPRWGPWRLCRIWSRRPRFAPSAGASASSPSPTSWPVCHLIFILFFFIFFYTAFLISAMWDERPVCRSRRIWRLELRHERDAFWICSLLISFQKPLPSYCTRRSLVMVICK